MGRIARLHTRRDDFVLRLGRQCSTSFRRPRWRYQSCRAVSKVRSQNIHTTAWFINARSLGMVKHNFLQHFFKPSSFVFEKSSFSAQGAIEIVQLMFKMQPAEKKMSLFCTDIQKMTPLHCAAMFDHPELVEFLVNEGADINALGKFNIPWDNLNHKVLINLSCHYLFNRQRTSFVDPFGSFSRWLANRSCSYQIGCEHSLERCDTAELVPSDYHQWGSFGRFRKGNQRKHKMQHKVQLEWLSQWKG